MDDSTRTEQDATSASNGVSADAGKHLDKHAEEPNGEAEETGATVHHLRDAELSPAHRERFSKLGLFTDALLVDHGWQSIDNDRTLADAIRYPGNAPAWQGGVLIPFHVPGASRPQTFAVLPNRKRSEGRGSKRREIDCELPPDSSDLIYWPRTTPPEDYLDTSQYLAVVEGLEAAVFMSSLMPTIGLAGERSQRKLNRLPREILTHTKLEGRRVLFVLDAFTAQPPAHNDSQDAKIWAKSLRYFQALAGLFIKEGATVNLVHPDRDKHPLCDTVLDVNKFAIDAADGDSGAGTSAILEIVRNAPPIRGAFDPEKPLHLTADFSYLDGSPVPANQIVPLGYYMTAGGALLLDDGGEAPTEVHGRGGIWITKVLTDAYNGSISKEIAFQANGQHWRTAVVPAEELQDRASMVRALARKGAEIGPVAADTIKFLYASANTNTFDEQVMVRRLGWHEIHGRKAFVLDQVLGADGPIPGTFVNDRDQDGKSRNLFSSYSAIGSYEKHKDALQAAAAADPVVALMIFGSLAAPLLEQLNAENFAIHLVGESSRGKTTALRIAGSIYGDSSSKGKIVGNWNATPAGMEMAAMDSNGLVMACDELQSMASGNPSSIVYMLINGKGKGRALRTADGLRDVAHWHLVLLSSGEHELAPEESPTGAQARVLQRELTSWSQIGAELAKALRNACLENHGQVGRAWIQHLLSLDAEGWSEIHRTYAKFAAKFGEGLAHVDARRADYFAMMATAESLAARWLDIGDPDGGMTISAWDSNPREEIRETWQRAADFLADRIATNPLAWPSAEKSLGDDYPRVPSEGFIKDDGTILIPPGSMRALMKLADLPLKSVQAGWLREGIIHPGMSRGKPYPQKVAWVRGEKMRCFALDRELLKRAAMERNREVEPDELASAS